MSREQWEGVAFFATIYMGITIYGCIDLEGFEKIEEFLSLITISAVLIVSILVMDSNVPYKERQDFYSKLAMFFPIWICPFLLATWVVFGIIQALLFVLFSPVYAYDLVDKTYLNPPKSSIEILEGNCAFLDETIEKRQKTCLKKAGWDAPYCKNTWLHRERTECYSLLSQKK